MNAVTSHTLAHTILTKAEDSPKTTKTLNCQRLETIKDTIKLENLSLNVLIQI